MNIADILKKIDERYIRSQAAKMTPHDVVEVQTKAEQITEVVAENGLLRKYLAEVKLALALVSDYWAGRYRRVPYWAIAAIAFAMLYVINPFDLIPDFIVGAGQLDDLAVVAACLRLLRRELERYAAWREERKNDPVDVTAEWRTAK